ncbi:MAG TPA: cytidylate kinase-like family protein [Dysgonamonadaceae bacterium]|jgi:cytidylate kinase|nr:cytidylate kinase-like family protein [Dysgonamonadaceae bacterium]
MDEKKYVINIGRQLGSGGHLIGEELSRQLGIPLYDKELIELASKESGLGKEFFEQMDEKKTHSIFGGFFGLRNSSVDEIYLNESYLCNETLFKIQSDVIRELAEKQSCIFIGRCADYVLKDHPRAVNIFITADIEDRIKRVSETYHLTSRDKALTYIKKMDKKRAGYYNYYTDKKWGVAESYHLCVNSSVLGIDKTVAFIRRFAEEKLGAL